jgi:hypothetical protein
MGYYDVVLGLIPVVFGGVTGGFLALGFGLMVAIPFGGLGAIAVIGHAMFVNGPTDVSTQSTSAINASTDAPAVDIVD